MIAGTHAASIHTRWEDAKTQAVAEVEVSEAEAEAEAVAVAVAVAEAVAVAAAEAEEVAGAVRPDALSGQNHKRVVYSLAVCARASPLRRGTKLSPPQRFY
jgi:hypothetical protein